MKRTTEAEMNRDSLRIEQHSGVGLLWIAGWLFTIGYLDLTFWRGVLAIILWPYDLGAHFAVTQS